MNGYDEPKALVEKFVREKGLKQHVLLMGGRVAREAYGVTGYPTTFLIDREGKVVEHQIGFGPGSAAEKERKIRNLLAEKEAPQKASGAPETKPSTD